MLISIFYSINCQIPETSEVMELGKAKIEIEYNVAYNQKIDEPNVENNIVEDKENENIQNDNIVSDDFIDFEI